jgi:hypothetical protein
VKQIKPSVIKFWGYYTPKGKTISSVRNIPPQAFDVMDRLNPEWRQYAAFSDNGFAMTYTLRPGGTSWKLYKIQKALVNAGFSTEEVIIPNQYHEGSANYPHSI